MADATTTTPAEIQVLSPRRRWWANARTSLFWMFVIAFALRFLIIVIGHTYKFRTSDQNFGFGWEMGRIGRALASGRGFSDPFQELTGPTAWEPPLYPFLIAGVFKIFGIYSHASAFVLLIINSIFSSLTCIPIFLVGKRLFGEKVAVGSAWTWALLPYITYWCTRWVWETSLSALLMTTILLLTLRMHEKDGLKQWWQFGALWGIAALNSPSLLSFLPVSGLWGWYHRWKAGKRSLGGVALASLIFIGCITPWLIRNHQTFGKWIFLRSNFGAELRMGNGPGADGTWMSFLHPTQNVYEMHLYERMGEAGYVAQRKQEAVAWIKEDPARFLFVSFKKFIYYWAGTPKTSEFPPPELKNSLFLASSILCFWGLGRALRKKTPGAWLLFLMILSYSAVYYVVFPHARYRHPVEPVIVILGVFLLCETEKRTRAESAVP